MLLLQYLHDRRRVLLAGLLLCVPMGGLMLLYGLTLPQVGYCFLVTGVLSLVFATPDFVRYRREVRNLTAGKRRAAEGVPEPLMSQNILLQAPLPQKLLTETAELLRIRAAELESQAASQQEELMDYYTLWVHQVKTPLAAIRLILQSGQLPAPEAEALGQELFKIERYMEMLLGYLRIQSLHADLRLELRPVRPIAAKAVKKFATQFIYKKLRVDLKDFSNQVVTDEKWLLFVLEQLISNAVKYTNTGGITISMDSGNVLSITDTGVGIDPADLPRVCERGFTGRNGRAERSSTGLGLYLCKSVLDKLQTPFEIQSELGQGTTVLLYLGRPEAPRD